jgi:hypothetical protein
VRGGGGMGQRAYISRPGCAVSAAEGPGDAVARGGRADHGARANEQLEVVKAEDGPVDLGALQLEVAVCEAGRSISSLWHTSRWAK